jgi:hypothetical protein
MEGSEDQEKATSTRERGTGEPGVVVLAVSWGCVGGLKRCVPEQATTKFNGPRLGSMSGHAFDSWCAKITESDKVQNCRLLSARGINVVEGGDVA